MSRTLRAVLILLLFWPLSWLMFWPAWAQAAGDGADPGTLTVSAGDGEEIPVERYGDGRHTLLWLAPDYGFRDSHRGLAKALADGGYAVWLVNLTDALFLPRGPDALREVDGAVVADLLVAAHAANGGPVAVVAEEYSAIPALRGIRAWQQRAPETDILTGAVLFTPALYAGVPALGRPPPYVPVARATNVPILVIQPAETNNRWYLDGLLERLGSAGAEIYLKPLPEVRSVFYFEEPTPAEERARKRLAGRLPGVLALLEHTPHPLAAAPEPPAEKTGATGLDHALAPYRGTVRPQALDLETASGTPYRLQDYSGQVTVLNFWATWCPPCVEEIPSLNRLRKHMEGLPFDLVSVNYAEGPAEIRAFMDKVQVDFPVLLDPGGRVAADWGVFTLPATFVIGPDATIVYGVNAAIAWDAPEVVEALKALLPKGG
ncbi:MAG: TlpA disulfide reductase family protein [Gammaproteobacteria bacterium]|nr:TlpA disulfide reductase family protein [Gammaproteobacteria bacterium]